MQVDDVLTPDAVEFLTDLQREFGDRRRELLARRAERLGRLADGRAARLPRGDGRRARRRLADRPVPGRDRRPSRRDHRPGRPEDGDQRAQLGREGLHGRLRGRELPHVGELHLRPAEPDGCARADDLARHGREAVLVEGRGRRAVRPPARLAPRGAPLRGRRRRRCPARCSTSGSTSSGTTGATGGTSTSRSSSRTSRRGSGTTSSSSRRSGSASRRGRSRRPS